MPLAYSALSIGSGQIQRDRIGVSTVAEKARLLFFPLADTQTGDSIRFTPSCSCRRRYGAESYQKLRLLGSRTRAGSAMAFLRLSTCSTGRAWRERFDFELEEPFP